MEIHQSSQETAISMDSSVEVKSIMDDIYGKSSSRALASSSSQCVLDADGRRQLKEAFSLIPEAEKIAYLQALGACPHLIELESSPKKYMRFTGNDPQATARLIVSYWEHRKLVFGQRAFLPMINNNGEGALTEDDSKLLDTGFAMILAEDLHGRTTFYHDRSRLTNRFLLDPRRRLRCLYYLLQVASENEKCQTAGMTVMSVYGEKVRASSFDRASVKETIDLFQHASFPIHVKAFHLVMISKRPILDNVIPITLQCLQQWPFLRKRTIVHAKLPKETLMENFKKYGFDQEKLPKVPVGGCWTIGCFKQWLDERKENEERLYQKCSVDHELALEDLDADALLEDEDMDDEECKRKRRRADAVYARRKRARQKIEVQVTQDQIDRLERQQAGLQQTNDHLESLLAKAKQLVEAQENPSSEAKLNVNDLIVPTVEKSWTTARELAEYAVEKPTFNDKAQDFPSTITESSRTSSPMQQNSQSSLISSVYADYQKASLSAQSVSTQDPTCYQSPAVFFERQLQQQLQQQQDKQQLEIQNQQQQQQQRDSNVLAGLLGEALLQRFLQANMFQNAQQPAPVQAAPNQFVPDANDQANQVRMLQQILQLQAQLSQRGNV